jgi:uncharacterized protein YlbG (UPF0298 family)
LEYDSNLTYHSTLINFKFKFSNLPNTFGCKTSILGFCRITFPSDIAQLFEEAGELWFELSADNVGIGRTVNDIAYNCFNVTSVKAIKSLKEQRILKKQELNIATLRLNNWQKTLSPSEILERDQQITTLDKLLYKVEQQRINWTVMYIEFNNVNNDLRKLVNGEFCKKVNFKRITHFQPSMTFVQNTQYRNAVKYYQETLSSLGINMEVFDSFEQITEYGVREIPQVYELWVLISIIKTLEGTYGYQPNPSDVEQLAKEISPKNVKLNQELVIRFTEDLPDRQVKLFYQKTLPNGKRPDFVLEIQTNKNKIYLVLDAKFKKYNPHKKEEMKEIETIKEKYSGNKYYVFVVHPCKDSKLLNLGSRAIDANGDIPIMPFHQYGYLSAQPNFTDNLKKVIGMAFEYLIENSYNAKTGNALDPKPLEEKLFCLNCGTSHTELVRFTRPRLPERYHYTNTCQNSECGHVAYFDYCWNCKTKLYKHGSYWDYHRTSIWSPFDIHCPNCGLTLADK